MFHWLVVEYGGYFLEFWTRDLFAAHQKARRHFNLHLYIVLNEENRLQMQAYIFFSILHYTHFSW